jgi:hypothetical protein
MSEAVGVALPLAISWVPPPTATSTTNLAPARDIGSYPGSELVIPPLQDRILAINLDTVRFYRFLG